VLRKCVCEDSDIHGITWMWKIQKRKITVMIFSEEIVLGNLVVMNAPKVDLL